jgi:hypothetical protein
MEHGSMECTISESATSMKCMLNLMETSLNVAAGGYCSIGVVEPYFGDVTSHEALAAAVKSVSFRNEIILMAETCMTHIGDVRSDLEAAGYGHVLILSDSEHTCKKSRYGDHAVGRTTLFELLFVINYCHGT